MSLSKDQILGCDDLPRERVDVPEWGGFVFVRTMNGAERDQLEAHMMGDRFKNIRATMAVLTCCDEEGRSLFEPGDVEAVGKKSSAGLDRLFAVAVRINKLSKDDIDQLEKN